MNLNALSFPYTHAPSLLILHIPNSGFNSHSLRDDGSGSSADIPLYFFSNNFPSLRFLRWMRKKCFIMKSIVQHTHFNLLAETKGQNDVQQQVCGSVYNRTICKKNLINICHGKWIDVCAHTCAPRKTPYNFNFLGLLIAWFSFSVAAVATTVVVNAHPCGEKVA